MQSDFEAFKLQRQYTDKISSLRMRGNLAAAILECKKATKRFPDNNFYFKILGDLYLEDGNYREASLSYIENLKRIGETPHLFKTFAKFYKYLSDKVNEDFLENYKIQLTTSVYRNEFTPIIIEKLVDFLRIDYEKDKELRQFLILSDDDRNIDKITKLVREWERNKNAYNLSVLMDYRLNAADRTKSHEIDKHIVSVLERWGNLEGALTIAYELVKIITDPIVFRTLLRLCRKIGDYSVAEKLFLEQPERLIKTDFNSQYELVYYYSSKKDENALKNSLSIIHSTAQRSLPISRTLYNFYLQFNMFDEAKKLREHIVNLSTKTQVAPGKKVRNIAAEEETEEGVWERLRELVSEQEHNRQLIAMRELLKGFSHELGQPITNIRYATQLHQKKVTMGLSNTDELSSLLENILKQTERIGHLLSRFRPIVSSKSENSLFSVCERINTVFSDVEMRLKGSGITYNVSGNNKAEIWGDAIQFDQIIYNLINNSIHAIKKKQVSGMINVNIIDNKDEVYITFSDNGTGISPKIQQKIFEPFFTTKDPSNDGNGGEGLGLFIIWNIIKILGGKITLDNEYQDGASFIIQLRKKEQTSE